MSKTINKNLQELSDKEKSLWTMRHSAEHVLTMAMIRLFGEKNIIMAMGPATDDGYYFDFDSPQNFKISESDFEKIEKEMKKIIAQDLLFKREKVTPADARKLFKGNPYKKEWIDEIEKSGKKVSIYKTGDKFVDLCSGPHVASTGKIGPFKLTKIAGAYWRGDEKNKMLTRIYGTAFESKKELEKYLWQQEEAKKRDHRILGKKLDLFVINEDIGKGLPLLTPKGTVIRDAIRDYEKELERKYGFKQVCTPHIAKNDLYKRTGHWDHYQDVMYAPFGIDNETYVLKPMNCPHHYMIYASRPRSYRDLPIRYAEAGTCYRYEKSGELGGLVRVRALTIDDSHILMREDQTDQEFHRCIQMVRAMYDAFGLKSYWVRLSLNNPADDDGKYIADEKIWKEAGKKLENVVKKSKLTYKVEKGEASFYGPKIDFMVKDVLGRQWQMSTLQLDLFMAKRLNLVYIDNDGKEKHPAILHRGLTGSLERTIGLLIEHYAGKFPLWLAPIQVVIIPITDRHVNEAQNMKKQLEEAHVRVELDERSESMQAKIRDATLQKIPYMGIIGDKEIKDSSVSVRTRDGDNLGKQKLDVFIKTLQKNIEKKTEEI